MISCTSASDGAAWLISQGVMAVGETVVLVSATLFPGWTFPTLSVAML